MECTEFKNLIPLYISDEIEVEKKILFEKHTIVCEKCASELAFENNILKALSEDKYDVPDGLNRSVLVKLSHSKNIFMRRLISYSVAASVILFLIFTLTFKPAGDFYGSVTFNSDTSSVKPVQNKNQSDYVSADFLDGDFDDMIVYENTLYDDSKWTSDNVDIFDSESDIINDMITLEELESYDDMLALL